MSDLDELLTQAREADPADRINLRDPIAAFGESAVDSMVDWLGDPRLAAFAIRVLERIGREPNERSAVITILRAVDRSDLPSHLTRDLDSALESLGASTIVRRTAAHSGFGRIDTSPGSPGVSGRGYWVMRTSPWERPFLWAEARAGRLRQGWGTEEDQNLEVIATAVLRGQALSGSQREARRALRMLTTWDHGIRVGDVVVAPNLPEYGRLAIFRVSGPYRWSPVAAHRFGERFGHVLPVELLVADIDRHGLEVTDGLRSILRVQTRLYNISGYGGDVERLLGSEVAPDRWGELWTDGEYERLFGLFPPDGPRPTEDAAEMVGIEFGRTADAISWQWDDGAAYCTGRSASTTSETLKAWLDRRGLQP